TAGRSLCRGPYPPPAPPARRGFDEDESRSCRHLHLIGRGPCRSPRVYCSSAVCAAPDGTQSASESAGGSFLRPLIDSTTIFRIASCSMGVDRPCPGRCPRRRRSYLPVVIALTCRFSSTSPTSTSRPST